MSYQCVFIRELKRKWWIIAIFVIVLGITVGVEKTYFGNQIIQSSAFHTEKMVQVGYDKGYSNAGTEFNYSAFLGSYSEMNKFLDVTSSIYDYKKFDANWGQYDLRDKIEWLKRHIFIININGGVVQYGFFLRPEEPKDTQYIKEYGEALLDTYITFSEERMKAILPIEKYTVVNKFTIFPESHSVTPKKSLLKYGFAGGVLGFIIGCFIIAILAMGKYRNGRC